MVSMATTQKLDLYKKYKAEYITPRKPALVKTTPAQYITISGSGAPGSADFQNKIGALYGVAYTMKMTKKFAGKDYKVCPLEGLYWGSGKEESALSIDPKELNWTLIMRVPDFLKEKDLQQAVAQIHGKGKTGDFDAVTLERMDEGTCVQMLHIGRYNQECGTIAQMMTFAEEKGLACHGKHHEIYLSDPRRVAPERLRTILRLPVR
jgi:hypothetical protein